MLMRRRLLALLLPEYRAADHIHPPVLLRTEKTWRTSNTHRLCSCCCCAHVPEG